MEVAPGEFPIEALRSKSPVMLITSNGRLTPPTTPFKMRSALVPSLFASKFTVRSRALSAASLRKVLVKVILLSVVVKITSALKVTASW